jgi:hypothetical protein
MGQYVLVYYGHPTLSSVGQCADYCVAERRLNFYPPAKSNLRKFRIFPLQPKQMLGISLV